MSILIVLASLILTGCGGITAILGSSSNPAKTPPTKVISLDAANFAVAYDGEGSVTFSSSEIILAPKPATAANETHAALVFIKETVDTPVQDFELTVDLTTSQQLRQNTAANDWEVFWLFFGYKGNITDKTTNYYISKPSTGSELGLAHGEVGQKFLGTDSVSKTAVGGRHKFKFVRKGTSFSVYRDDQLFYSYTDGTFPSALYSGKGALGFYSEDAEVKIHSVQLKRLDSGTVASEVLPLLTSNSLESRSPQSVSTLNATVTNSAQTGDLFWSCTYKKITGEVSGLANTDCLSVGTIGNNGLFSWTPTLDQIGTWIFNFEASEKRGGFGSKSFQVQVRPDWTGTSQLFLFDPEFSISKTLDATSILTTRAPASADNNKTVNWPALTTADTIDLSGLSEANPWRNDAVSLKNTLHFDALQDDQGLPLSVANLGTTQDLRLSYWFKRDNTDSKTAVLANHTNGTLQSRHWIGVISSSYTDGGSEVVCDDPNAANGGWMFVTTQVTAGKLKTFVSGREVCSQNLPATYNFASPLRLAPRVQTFFPFAGQMSEIAGYAQSTPAEIFHDFTATADRYRPVKVGAINSSDLVLHWDAANADRGMAPSASPAGWLGWFDLAPKALTKTLGGFDGNASSGFVAPTAATAYMQFDGVDDYMQVTSQADLSTLGPAWTIEAWLQPGAALGVDNNYPPNDLRHDLYKTIFEKAQYDNGNKLSHGLGLRLGKNNTVDAFYINNYGSTDTVSGGVSLNANQWYHVAVSFDKATSTLKSYVNGALESSKVVNIKQDSNNVAQSDGDVIGGMSDAFVGIPFDVDGRRRFNGRLAVLRVYQKSLADSAVKAHCLAQKDRYGVTCN
ncbi:LamG domain-containing protein [Bdellovibrio bacteriovorus]|uniref:LamG domain-containing protein n=1 Tax=Bdellovibrio bacteriovorus TaxID=959 RepID=UPI0035A59237